MGLAGARNSAVTGLQAQSTNIAITSDNIANASTIGFKAVKGSFSTLVTNAGASNIFSSGGVSVTPQNLIDSQGLIESTGRVTDVAVSGAGFFAVQDTSGSLLLTRAGSFSINNKGELVNAAGFTLLGWPLDNDGRKPGTSGNANTTPAESADSLVVVDTNSASGTASATTTIKVGMNLNAGQTVYQGATVVLTPQSAANASISSSDIIVPGAGMQAGDQISFQSSTPSSVAKTVEYGGFTTSKDIALSALFGSSAGSTKFVAGADLADGDQFTVTTLSSGTVTFTFKASSPNKNSGEFNSLETLADAMNVASGLTARVSGTTLYVSSDNANEAITFNDVAGSNLYNELGFSNVAIQTSGNRYNTFAGLEAILNATSTLSSKINRPTAGATIDVFAKDPLQTLTVTKTRNQVTIDLKSDNNGINTPTSLIVPVEVDGVSTMVPEILGPAAGATAGVATVSFSDGTNSGTFSYGGIGKTKNINLAAIFGATTALGGTLADTTDRFIAGTGGLDDGETITFSDGTATQVVTFNDVATSALAVGEFNSLITLAAALESGGNFIAKVSDGRLFVASAATANRAVSITASTITGGNDGAALAAQFGGDFVDNAADGCTIVAARTTGNQRFANLTQLDSLIEGITGFSTTDPVGGNASIGVSSVSGTQITIGGASNSDLLKELGIAAGAVGDGYFAEMGIDGITTATNGNVPPGGASATVSVTYDSADRLKNMAGGNVTPQFSRNIRIYDALGTGHDFSMAFIKTGVQTDTKTSTWAVEFYSLHPSEISNDVNNDGLLVSGTITFNGDGSLAAVSSALVGDISIEWTTGSTPNVFTFNLGTAGEPSGTTGATVIGLTDGLRQFDSAYNVDFVEQNGVAAGQFGGIEVSDDGTVFAKFSNGQVKAIYKLPIVTVANINALAQKTGNVFAVTQASGDVNLKDAGFGGAGVIVPGALEGSTADIATELTKTIGIQANYNANATLISTVKAMEEELNRRL